MFDLTISPNTFLILFFIGVLFAAIATPACGLAVEMLW